MKKSSIRVIIGLMSFALLGVIAMQLYFLTQSYTMQSKIFDRSVNEALENVVTKLSRQDADKFLNEKAHKDGRAPHDELKSEQRIYTVANPGSDERSILNEDSLKEKKNKTAREKKIALLRDSLQRMIINQKLDEALTAPMNLSVSFEGYIDEFGQEQMRATRKLTRLPNNARRKIYKYDTIRYVYPDPQYGNQVIYAKQINPLWKEEQQRIRIRKEKDRKMREVKKLLAADSIANLTPAGKPSVMQNLFAEYQRSGEPLANRLDRIWIDSLLRFELHNKGITLPFTYDVTTANNDSLIFSNITASTEKPKFEAANSYQTPIFSKEVINDPGMIKLAFPSKNSLILGRMKVTMATTAGLLFVLIFCFGYTIFTILRQKKISEMKTDFINNMTHEFKTPVSTIMIASEALKDTEITADASRISRLANIIYEENARLGSHIERVLNIARIDRNDFKLESMPVNINEMITIVLDSMALKLQKAEAQVELHLEAENAIIQADELHFSNVLYNLIDNAIKYSEGAPKITISSLNKNGHVLIKVADEGIGMSRDQQTKIFEQFYRIPTGNVHNVKGFGLGLSYVNTIVKRLNGTINVRSEKDKGSEFELRFATA